MDVEKKHWSLELCAVRWRLRLGLGESALGCAFRTEPLAVG